MLRDRECKYYTIMCKDGAALLSSSSPSHEPGEIKQLILFRSKTLRRPRALSNRFVIKFSKLVQRLLHSGQLLRPLAICIIIYGEKA
jgi:hypothetical protein